MERHLFEQQTMSPITTVSPSHHTQSLLPPSIMQQQNTRETLQSTLPTNRISTINSNRFRPPDVETALSSMLWTPYERTPTDSSSSSDEDDKVNSKLRKSKSCHDTPQTGQSAVTTTTTTTAATTCLSIVYNNYQNNYPVTTNQLLTATQSNALTHYVPSIYRTKLNDHNRYDNINGADNNNDNAVNNSNNRFSYPCYGYIPSLTQYQREPPSYESLYQTGLTTAEQSDSNSGSTTVLLDKRTPVVMSNLIRQTLNAATSRSKNSRTNQQLQEQTNNNCCDSDETAVTRQMVHSFTADSFITHQSTTPLPVLQETFVSTDNTTTATRTDEILSTSNKSPEIQSTNSQISPNNLINNNNNNKNNSDIQNTVKSSAFSYCVNKDEIVSKQHQHKLEKNQPSAKTKKNNIIDENEWQNELIVFAHQHCDDIARDKKTGQYDNSEKRKEDLHLEQNKQESSNIINGKPEFLHDHDGIKDLTALSDESERESLLHEQQNCGEETKTTINLYNKNNNNNNVESSDCNIKYCRIESVLPETGCEVLQKQVVVEDDEKPSRRKVSKPSDNKKTYENYQCDKDTIPALATKHVVLSLQNERNNENKIQTIHEEIKNRGKLATNVATNSNTTLQENIFYVDRSVQTDLTVSTSRDFNKVSSVVDVSRDPLNEIDSKRNRTLLSVKDFSTSLKSLFNYQSQFLHKHFFGNNNKTLTNGANDSDVITNNGNISSVADTSVLPSISCFRSIEFQFGESNFQSSFSVNNYFDNIVESNLNSQCFNFNEEYNNNKDKKLLASTMRLNIPASTTSVVEGTSSVPSTAKTTTIITPASLNESSDLVLADTAIQFENVGVSSSSTLGLQVNQTANISDAVTNATTSVFLPATDIEPKNYIKSSLLSLNGAITTPKSTIASTQPSLTIQVNQLGSSSVNTIKNNSNENIPNIIGKNYATNMNKNCSFTINSSSATTMATTTPSSNGVSVVNCYSSSVPNSNSVNNISNNLCQIHSSICASNGIDNSFNSSSNNLNDKNNSNVNIVQSNENHNDSNIKNDNVIKKSITASTSTTNLSRSNFADLNNIIVSDDQNSENLKSEINKNIRNNNNNIKITDQIGLPVIATTSNGNVNKPSHQHRSLTRTYTSTECQTDDIPLDQITTTITPSKKKTGTRNAQNSNPNPNPNLLNQSMSNSNSSTNIAGSQTDALIAREQRRRERRERRRNNHLHHPHMLSPPPNHPPPPPLHYPGIPNPALMRPMLPDILHSHFPPPYGALAIPNPHHPSSPPPPPPPGMPPPPPPHHHPGGPPPGSSLITTPIISAVPIAATATMANDGRFTLPLPVIRRSPSERSGKGCCGQWFAGPPLRALIAVVALGGVACALGGAALGATGLAGPPTSHLTAALLMIGVGVILVTVSGAAWRMTAPGGPPCLGLGSTVDLGRCGRRPCSSRGGAPHGLLYPEFQHRPPPPSYQASMQEYRLRLLLLDRDRQNGVVRGGSPPPTYRSHAGSLLRTPLSTNPRSGNSNNNTGNAGTLSSIGGAGSEYSLPPSYRSRNLNTNINNNINSSGLLNSNKNNNNNNNNNSSSRPPTIILGDTDSIESSLGANNQLTGLSLTTNGNILELTTAELETPKTSTMVSKRDDNSKSAKDSNNQNADLINNNKNNNTNTNNSRSNANPDEKFNPRVLTNNNNKNFSTNSINLNSSNDSTALLGNSSNGRKELVTIVTISATMQPDESAAGVSSNGNTQQNEMEILAHL